MTEAAIRAAVAVDAHLGGMDEYESVKDLLDAIRSRCVGSALAKLDLAQAQVQAALDAVAPILKEEEKEDEWASILEAAKAQDIKWKIAMPTLDSEHGVYVWALKSQEEMGELSAALLARIGNRRIPEDTALEECDQLIAVLLRVRTLLRKE